TAPSVGPCAAVAALTAAEVDGIVQAAAGALNRPATIAVVDRTGLPLAVYRKAGAAPGNEDQAVGVARTAALFSNNQAPLSSRTVRFISGVHFPPGVENAPVAALYGIEQTNRGCDFGVLWNPGQCLPRARSLDGIVNDKPCNATDASGCGPGIVTGKIQPDDGPYPQSPFDRPVNAGGIPVYRAISVTGGTLDEARLVGGVGVIDSAGDTDLAELAAATGAFAPGFVPVPKYPLPEPQNVFIDGIRLPFLGPDRRLRFDGNGLPAGLEQPDGTSPDATPFDPTKYVLAPAGGRCAPDGYLVGPNGGTLSASDVDAIVQRAIATAKRTRAIIRLPLNSYARMVIAVADVDGTILAIYRMPDTTIFSIDVSVAKARNMAAFGNNFAPLPAGTFVSARTVGFGAQPLYPPGIGAPPGPWYSLFLQNLATPCLGGAGIVFFAGSTALVRGGALVGGLGVSGDGIEQDDYVTVGAAGNLLPPQNKWADRLKVDGARLPMFKFPRHPEGVTECGGGPCS
ncbi:MAG TPA: heme-binding protein, partial [Thermoanaerobaculia bacterium]|nr:heme-binding protein [Thermoanaerobaculia bacterium]